MTTEVKEGERGKSPGAHHIAQESWDELEEQGKKCLSLGVRLMIDQIVSVDTSSQTYTIIAGFGLDWEANEDEIKRGQDITVPYESDAKYEVNWLNVIEFENQGGELSLRPGLNEFEGKWYNYYEVIFRGTFTVGFDCRNYPFDSQILPFVCVGINLSKAYFVPVRCRYDVFSVNTSYLAVYDWNFLSYDVDIKNVDWGYAKTKKKSDPSTDPALFYSTLMFNIKIERNWITQLIRILLWQFLLATIMFACAGIEPTNIDGRFSYQVGLLFSVIAFQFVISDQLPNLPYLTVIDKYNLVIMAMLIIGTAESFVVGFHDEGLFVAFDQDLDIFYLDKWFYVGYFLLFIAAHIAFLIYCRSLIQIEAQKREKYDLSNAPLKLNTVLSFDHIRKNKTDVDYFKQF